MNTALPWGYRQGLKLRKDGFMGKKLTYTPNSRIRSAIRTIWLRSRERAAALRRDGYCCQKCHIKQSKAKGREVAVEVHHVHGIIWDDIIQLIRDRVLQSPDRLQTLCKSCHEKEGG